MSQSAAVLCDDKGILEVLEIALKQLEIEIVTCPSEPEALELILAGRCSTLIVDFDLPHAEEVTRMASLLPAPQKPALLAVARRAWPGTGQAFKPGASRILYRPLEIGQVKEALRTDRKAKARPRKSARYEVKTLVYLDLESRTIPGITIDIGEHGLAIQATEPVPMSSNLAFRCVLPGTGHTLQGHADVVWASDQGRAGLFFSKLAPAARKHLKQWLSKRAAHNTEKHKNKKAARDLLPPLDADVSFVVSE